MSFDNVLWGEELLSIQASKLFTLTVALTQSEGISLSQTKTHIAGIIPGVMETLQIIKFRGHCPDLYCSFWLDNIC